MSLLDIDVYTSKRLNSYTFKRLDKEAQCKRDYLSELRAGLIVARAALCQ